LDDVDMTDGRNIMVDEDKLAPQEKTKHVRANLPYLQLFLIVGALLLAIWGLIYSDLQRNRTEIYSNNSNTLSNLALAFAKEAESSVKTIDVTLLDLRDRWHGEPAGFATALRKRQNYLEKEVAFQVAIADSDGKMVFSSLDIAGPPIDLSDREHFQVHKKRSTDELFISSPVIGRVSKRWSIQFTRPIYNDNKQFSGVIILSVSPEYFYRFYRSTTLPKDSVITLIRDGGEVLSRFPDPNAALGKTFASAPFLQPLAPQSGTFHLRSPFDGVDRINAWREVSGYDLTVTVGFSVREIEHLYREHKSRSMLAGTALSLLLLFVTYLKRSAIRQEQLAEQELQTNEERWRLALEAAGDGVWDWDIASNRVIFSDNWKRMLGHAPDEIGNDLDEWKKRVHPDDMALVMHEISEHFSGHKEVYECEHRILCKNGNWKWILDRGMVMLRDREGNPLRMVGTHTDISARKELEARLINLATTDSLTGLKNRRHFMESLENELARVKRYPDTKACVLMADLDHFKKINDTYGHAIGDAALKHFAQILTTSVRKSDFPGRLGGEEFAILLTETDLPHATEFAKSLCERLRDHPLQADHYVIVMTVSIGLTALDTTDKNGDQVLQRADSALYQAKTSGRDRATAISA
jgi:diguanylate cyclase (GGDEF)-like protein/PAS domain S-box-containing protein